MTRRSSVTALSTLFIAAAITQSVDAQAHGFAGQRFFPAGLATDDAFVADELDFLGSYSVAQGDGGQNIDDSGLSWEWAERISEDWQLSVGNQFSRVSSGAQARIRGWNNFEVGAKYQAFIEPEAESALALGLNAELGDTGSRSVGDSFSAYGPAITYAKGLGNLRSDWARPLAFTFVAQPSFPTSAAGSRELQWGYSLQYSLPYLEDFVRDTDMAEPLRSMIPLIEMPLTTCWDNCPAGHRTTGTINPGVIWVGKQSQLGIEATFPLNRDSGKGVGVLIQYHLYLDDIFPNQA